MSKKNIDSSPISHLQDIFNVKQENIKSQSLDISLMTEINDQKVIMDFHWIKDLDVLIIDLQDIGSTYYTYISTITYMLESAAKNDIEVIILDRPNPLGMLVYGPKRSNLGFIGMHPIPIRHGMTVGELSTMINEEGWLSDDLKLDNLKVIKMKKIPKSTQFYDWIAPSPNIPDKKTAFIYNGTCLFEGTNVSEGRGTEHPFKIIGAPPKWVTLNL